MTAMDAGRGDLPTGTWYIHQSSNRQLSATQFGLADDTLVPADYDADGKTDLAVYRGGIWYLLRSAQGFTAFQFGISNDIPAPADYDGDGQSGRGDLPQRRLVDFENRNRERRKLFRSA